MHFQIFSTIFLKRRRFSLRAVKLCWCIVFKRSRATYHCSLNISDATGKFSVVLAITTIE